MNTSQVCRLYKNNVNYINCHIKIKKKKKSPQNHYHTIVRLLHNSLRAINYSLCKLTTSEKQKKKHKRGADVVV